MLPQQAKESAGRNLSPYGEYGQDNPSLISSIVMRKLRLRQKKNGFLIKKTLHVSLKKQICAHK